jgi:hypothetical protein
MKSWIGALLTASVALAGAARADAEQNWNDYPTNARADYVYACMQANGQTREVLDKCSCSIDVIASILPYEKYVEAETVLSLRLRGGESVAQMQGRVMVEKVRELKLAQVEGELRCF